MRMRLVFLLPFVVLAGLAVGTMVHGRLPYPDARYILGDHYKYAAMAAHPFSFADVFVHMPPYEWRILVPLTVWVLHLGIYTGFSLVTLAGLVLAVGSLMWFLKGLGLSRPAVAAGGLALVCLGPMTGFSLYEYMRIDAFSAGLLTLGLAAAVHRKGWLVLLSLVLGVLSKETAIFGGLFALIWALEQHDQRLLRWAQATVIIQLLIFAALRHLIQAEWAYSFSIEFQQTYRGLTAFDLVDIAVRGTAGAWGMLLPLAVWHVWQRRSFWRSPAMLSLLVFCYSQLIVASGAERLAMYAFPVVIAASVAAVEDLSLRWRVSRWAIWTPILLVQLTWSYTYPPPLPWVVLPLHRPEIVLAMILTLVAAGWHVYRRITRISSASSATPRPSRFGAAPSDAIDRQLL